MIPKSSPSKVILRKVFSYKKGELYWRENFGKRKKGREVGTINPLNRNYKSVGFQGRRYYIHRLVWVYFKGPTKKFIDHKNGDKSDNRIRNLREASKAQNFWNSGKKKHNSSGIKGVTFKRRFFCARIGYEGKTHYIGTYKTLEEAGAAYQKVAKKLHGKFYYGT